LPQQCLGWILLFSVGTRPLLYGLIASSILGAIVTLMFRIETIGVRLDHVGEAESRVSPRLSTRCLEQK
jgi:hypothetical protein